MQKLFYTFRELSDKYGVEVEELRKWEQYFNLTAMQKGPNSMKRFSLKEVEKIEYLKYLIKDKGYSYEKAKELLSKPKTKRQDTPDLKEKLIEIRTFLAQLKAYL
jgi:DNA-binding transcriptional MerR regulator